MMTKQSAKVEAKIREICARRRGKKVETFEHIKSMATIVICDFHVRCAGRFAGMGEFVGRFMEMLDQTGTFNGPWIVAEALAQKGYVLLFNMDEQHVLDALEEVILIGEVMNA